MDNLTNQEILSELKNFDTPAITNVVATYPNHPFCLAIFDPWKDNWYTDQTVRCMYPELDRRVGYAVTCVYGLPRPGHDDLSFIDVAAALEDSKKPTIFVFQQNFPPELANKVGLSGGNMTSAMKALGCIGAISNGPSRDIDEIREMDFQYLLSGVTPGHGEMAVHAINVTVSVAGMDVSPGDIIHMDENGACTFPADRLRDVLDNARKLQDEENNRMKRFKSAKTAEEIREILTDLPYSKDKDAE
jgi:4-hydroxy-4-methyl-2-oxoglutarate aldolase